jgi:hypothetical protein
LPVYIHDRLGTSQSPNVRQNVTAIHGRNFGRPSLMTTGNEFRRLHLQDHWPFSSLAWADAKRIGRKKCTTRSILFFLFFLLSVCVTPSSARAAIDRTGARGSPAPLSVREKRHGGRPLLPARAHTHTQGRRKTNHNDVGFYF